MWLDARIPVRLVAAGSLADALAGGTDAAALVEDGVAVPPGVPAVTFPVGCACCLARSVAAAAFDRLFLARVKGEVPFFGRVVAAAASPAGQAAIAAALASDPVVPMRYRAATIEAPQARPESP
jgi:hypothetical protein